MGNDPFNYVEDFASEVTFNLEYSEEVFEGELQIPAEKLPKLSPTESRAAERALQALEKQNAIFNLDCNAGSDSYTLFGCDARSSHIYPKHIVKNYKAQKLTGVEVELFGLVDWFYPFGPPGETPENHELFSGSFKIKKQPFHVVGFCYVSSPVDDKEPLSLTATVRLQSVNGVITLEEAEQFAHDIRRLFSLLVSLPLSIKSSWVIAKGTGDRLPFHFWNTANSEDQFENIRSPLIRPGAIGSNQWSSLFENYFSGPKTFRKVWPKFIYCFDHPGAWEHELLAYVSVLDAYLEIYTDKKADKIKGEIFDELKAKVLALIEEYKSSHASEPAQVFDNLTEAFARLENTSLAVFEQRFDYLVGKLDPEIVQIIGFTEPEFTRLKQVRNKTAHGNSVTLRDSKNLTDEMVCRDKLRVLLMYLVYVDFGFTDLEFIHAISGCFAPFRRNANLDRMQIDRFGKLRPFYAVDKQNLDLARQLSRHRLYLALNAVNADELHTVNAEITQAMFDWSNNPNESSGKQLDEYLKGRFSHLPSPIQVSPGYIVCDNDHLEIHMGIYLCST